MDNFGCSGCSIGRCHCSFIVGAIKGSSGSSSNSGNREDGTLNDIGDLTKSKNGTASLDDWEDNGENHYPDGGTGLSVTGYRKRSGNGVEIYLYYQDRQKKMRIMTYDSSKRKGENYILWEKSEEIRVQNLEEAYTPMAGTTFVYDKEASVSVTNQ